MRILAQLFLVITSFSAVIAFAEPVTISEARIFTNSNNTRIVFSLSKASDYKIHQLKNPERVAIDFDNADLIANLKKISLDKSFIKLIRNKQYPDYRLRIVFDLTQPVIANSFKLKSNRQYGNRIVLDFKSKASKVSSSTKKIIKKPERNIIVVIDPGHGGKDPGAIGKFGTSEKNIVLAISNKLKNLINKEHGMRAVLTRKSDRYIALRKRVKLARKGKADMFIAIHSDAFKNRHSRGASVYALSARGASSEAAKWLAEKENYSELGGVNLKDKDNMLRSVLIDLSQTATIGASLDLGTKVLDQIGNITRLHHDKIEQAPFVVLKSPDIPSILVETGFLSNQQEEKMLGSVEFQTKIAKAITKGIKEYFWVHAPPNTKFAAEQREKKHIIAKGESLVSISKRYHVSIKQLRDMNKLAGDVLKVGQNIRIPSNA